jgi:hypothetical protein
VVQITILTFLDRILNAMLTRRGTGVTNANQIIILAFVRRILDAMSSRQGTEVTRIVQIAILALVNRILDLGREVILGSSIMGLDSVTRLWTTTIAFDAAGHNGPV